MVILAFVIVAGSLSARLDSVRLYCRSVGRRGRPATRQRQHRRDQCPPRSGKTVGLRRLLRRRLKGFLAVRLAYLLVMRRTRRPQPIRRLLRDPRRGRVRRRTFLSCLAQIQRRQRSRHLAGALLGRRADRRGSPFSSSGSSCFNHPLRLARFHRGRPRSAGLRRAAWAARTAAWSSISRSP